MMWLLAVYCLFAFLGFFCGQYNASQDVNGKQLVKWADKKLLTV